jgi:hypothetical protein
MKWQQIKWIRINEWVTNSSSNHTWFDQMWSKKLKMRRNLNKHFKFLCMYYAAQVTARALSSVLVLVVFKSLCDLPNASLNLILWKHMNPKQLACYKSKINVIIIYSSPKGLVMCLILWQSENVRFVKWWHVFSGSWVVLWKKMNQASSVQYQILCILSTQIFWTMVVSLKPYAYGH